MRRFLSIASLACLSLTPAWAQESGGAEAVAPEIGTPADLSQPAAEILPGQAILTEALEKGGFTAVRVVGSGFALREATAPEGATVYILLSKDGQPITASGEGEAAPGLPEGGSADPGSDAKAGEASQ